MVQKVAGFLFLGTSRGSHATLLFEAVIFRSGDASNTELITLDLFHNLCVYLSSLIK